MSEKKSTVLRAVPDERVAPHANGMPVMIALILSFIVLTGGFILGCVHSDAFYGIPLIILGIISWIVCPFIIAGLKVVAPNQALVLTLFGNYYGTLKTPGFYFVNPFVVANAPSNKGAPSSVSLQNGSVSLNTADLGSKKISLRTRTLNNNKQKVNDALGNPIIIGSVVIWHVADPTRAVFAVDNFEDYLSIQCDSTIRNIARLYPYDSMKDGDDEDDGEKTLRGSSSEVSEIMQNELSQRVADAGLVIEDVRITTLAYSDEIAAAMLQRQQAVAIIAARQKIVEGAVSMVKMAIDQLSEDEVVVLDEERKAAMVSNLLVVLCGNKDAQPIVNSGSIY